MPDKEGTGLGQIGGEYLSYQAPEPEDVTAAVRAALGGMLAEQELESLKRRTAEMEAALRPALRAVIDRWWSDRTVKPGSPLELQDDLVDRLEARIKALLARSAAAEEK